MRKKHMKWFETLIAVLVLTVAPSVVLAGENQAKEGTVALVNETVITQEEFDIEISQTQQQFAKMGRPLSDLQLKEMKKEILEKLINRELLYQESQKKGIKADETAINKQLTALKERFPSEAEYKSALSGANLSEATVRSQVGKGLAIQQFIDTQFGQTTNISDEETKTYYDNHPDSFKQPEQVQASHILIKVDPQAEELEKAEARKKIEEIKEKLQKGEDFGSLAKEISQCPSSEKGGDLGYFSRGQMAKPFEEAAFALKPGELSDVVETRFGYHLIKVTDKKPETAIAYADVKDRLQQYLKQEKITKEVSLYIANLKEKAKVERFLPESPE